MPSVAQEHPCKTPLQASGRPPWPGSSAPVGQPWLRRDSPPRANGLSTRTAYETAWVASRHVRIRNSYSQLTPELSGAAAVCRVRCNDGLAGVPTGLAIPCDGRFAGWTGLPHGLQDQDQRHLDAGIEGSAPGLRQHEDGRGILPILNHACQRWRQRDPPQRDSWRSAKTADTTAVVASRHVIMCNS
jgi:hypothetical protein